MSTIISLTLCLIFFPFLWISTCKLIALSGWSSLATHYASDAVPEGKKFNFQSMTIRSKNFMFRAAQYGSCLTIHISDEYIYLKPWLILSPGHAALRIPLTDMSYIGPAIFFGGLFKIEKLPEKKYTFYFGAARQLEKSGLTWQLDQK